VSDLIDFGDVDAGFSETESDGVDGKVAGVLPAGEAFLFCRGDELAVDDESGGGIHALRNAVFPLFLSLIHI